MPQLFFEPAVSKIDTDTYIIVPKNDTDTIDVADKENRTEIHSGSYRFIAKCNEIVKDIIVAFYGNPVIEDGVKNLVYALKKSYLICSLNTKILFYPKAER